MVPCGCNSHLQVRGEGLAAYSYLTGGNVVLQAEYGLHPLFKMQLVPLLCLLGFGCLVLVESCLQESLLLLAGFLPLLYDTVSSSLLFSQLSQFP